MGTPDYTKRAVANYRNKFDVMQLRLPKGIKEQIEPGDKSIHDYIVQLVIDDIESKKDE